MAAAAEGKDMPPLLAAMGMPVLPPADASLKDTTHAICDVPASSYKVRGPDYSNQRKKQNATEGAFDVAHVELFRHAVGQTELAKAPQGWLQRQRALGDKRHFLVLNFWVPTNGSTNGVPEYAPQKGLAGAAAGAASWVGSWFTPSGGKPNKAVSAPPSQEAAAAATGGAGGHAPPSGTRADGEEGGDVEDGPYVHRGPLGEKEVEDSLLHMVVYFTMREGALDLPVFRRVWDRFNDWAQDDKEYRSDRWKVIPRIMEGPWVVKNAVPTKPSLLGRKLRHTWSHGDGFVEADVDVRSRGTAAMLCGMLAGYAQQFVIDIAFMAECREEDELPEAVFAAVRMHRMDLDRVPLLRAPYGTEEAAAEWMERTGGKVHHPAPGE